MSLQLGKILADPDRVIMGDLVLTRRVVDGTGRTAAEAKAGAGIQAEAARVQDEQHRSAMRPLEKSAPHELSAAEEDVLREMRERDRDVRMHERKHLAAAGDLARGAPRYHYQIGPDGKPYAVGGQVQIDTSAVPGDAEATARKGERIRHAALAPGQPSGPDLAVAQDAGAGTGRYELRLYA